MAIVLEKQELRVYEIRKKKHRRRVAIIILASIITLLVIGLTAIYMIVNKKYNGYEVIHTIERSDSKSARYYPYEGGFIRLSRDGIMAMNSAGSQLFNGTFEMKDPILDSSGKFVAVSDRDDKMLQIFNGSGGVTPITVLNPIIKSEVADQGVTAVLMSGDDVNFITLYDTEGTDLVNLRTVNKDDGYPLDITLSNDGRKFATSYVSFNNGILQCKVTFYNFGNIGENYDSSIVGAYDYGQTLVPDVEFINNNTACAFGDDKFSIYSVEEVPKDIYDETFTKEVKTVFYSNKYIGFVFNNAEGTNKYQVVIYNLEGKVVLNKEMNYDYNNIFLSGDEIVMYSGTEWVIWKMDGKEKFHYTFSTEISYLMAGNSLNKYLIIDNQKIDDVKLIEK